MLQPYAISTKAQRDSLTITEVNMRHISFAIYSAISVFGNEIQIVPLVSRLLIWAWQMDCYLCRRAMHPQFEFICEPHFVCGYCSRLMEQIRVRIICDTIISSIYFDSCNVLNSIIFFSMTCLSMVIFGKTLIAPQTIFSFL